MAAADADACEYAANLERRIAKLELEQVEETTNLLEQSIGLLQGDSGGPDSDPLDAAMRGLGFRLERLGAPKVAFLPKELRGGKVLQENGAPNMWLTTKDSVMKLPAEVSGIAYRASKNEADQLKTVRGPQWGQPVVGTDEGDGWVRVEMPREEGQIVVCASRLEQRLSVLEEAAKPSAGSLALSYADTSGKLQISYRSSKQVPQKGRAAALADALEKRVAQLEQAPGIADYLAQLEGKNVRLESMAALLEKRTGDLEQAKYKTSRGLKTGWEELDAEVQNVKDRLAATYLKVLANNAKAAKQENGSAAGLALSYGGSGQLKLGYNSSTATSANGTASCPIKALTAVGSEGHEEQPQHAVLKDLVSAEEQVANLQEMLQRMEMDIGQLSDGAKQQAERKMARVKTLLADLSTHVKKKTQETVHEAWIESRATGRAEAQPAAEPEGQLEGAATQIPVDLSQYVARSDYEDLRNKMALLTAQSLNRREVDGRIEGHVPVAEHEALKGEMKEMVSRACRMQPQAQADPQANTVLQQKVDAVTKRCEDLVQETATSRQANSVLEQQLHEVTKRSEELMRETSTSGQANALLQQQLDAVTKRCEELMEVASKAPSPVKPSGQEKLLLSENEALKNQLRKSVPIAEYANLQAELQTAKVEQDTLTRRLEVTVSPTKSSELQRELDEITLKLAQSVPRAEHANLQAELQTARVEQDTLKRRLELTVSPTKNAGLARELDAVTVKYEQAIAMQQSLYDEQKALRNQVQASIPKADYDALMLKMQGQVSAEEHQKCRVQLKTLDIEYGKLLDRLEEAQRQAEAGDSSKKQLDQQQALHGQYLQDQEDLHAQQIRDFQKQREKDLQAQLFTADENEVLKKTLEQRLTEMQDLQSKFQLNCQETTGLAKDFENIVAERDAYMNETGMLRTQLESFTSARQFEQPIEFQTGQVVATTEMRIEEAQGFSTPTMQSQSSRAYTTTIQDGGRSAYDFAGQMLAPQPFQGTSQPEIRPSLPTNVTAAPSRYPTTLSAKIGASIPTFSLQGSAQVPLSMGAPAGGLARGPSRSVQASARASGVAIPASLAAAVSRTTGQQPTAAYPRPAAAGSASFTPGIPGSPANKVFVR